MDIRDFLQIGTARLNADILVDKIEEDPDIFEIVWGIMLEDTYPLSMRASWVISHFARKHPYFLEPRFPEMVEILPAIKTESVRRNLLHVISILPIPEESSGRLFDLCYGYLESPGSAIAIRAYAMTILYHISNLEPELKPELISLFEAQKDAESAGVYARAKILLQKLYKEIS